MIRILIVDDDFMVAKVHAGFVASLRGFEVIATATTGAEALDAIDRHKPHLVLLDIYLPDISGLDVVERIRESGKDVDVIIISAARDADSVKQALRGGVAQYLIKPFDRETFQERLRQYARLRAELAGMSEADQPGLDRVFGSPTAGPGETPMPKGFTSETAALVLSALRAAGDEGLSASECGTRTGLSRVSARRYLEHLAARGLAEARSRYGTAGRPERRFRAVERGKPS